MLKLSMKLSISCTRFQTNYSHCTGWSREVTMVPLSFRHKLKCFFILWNFWKLIYYLCWNFNKIKNLNCQKKQPTLRGSWLAWFGLTRRNSYVLNQHKELRKNLFCFVRSWFGSETFGSDNFFRFLKNIWTSAKKLTFGLQDISKPVPEQTHWFISLGVGMAYLSDLVYRLIGW
jgi:hypothetical protein